MPGNTYDTPTDVEGTYATPTYTTLSSDTPEYSSVVDANGSDGVKFELRIDWDTSPTDGIYIEVVENLDGTFDGDEIPIFAMRVDAPASVVETFHTITIPNVEHCRLKITQTGTTDSHDFAARAVKYRKVA